MSETTLSSLLPNAKHMTIWKHLNAPCSTDETSTRGRSHLMAFSGKAETVPVLLPIVASKLGLSFSCLSKSSIMSRIKFYLRSVSLVVSIGIFVS